MRYITILLATLAAAPALAQTQQFYGSDGDYLGSSMPSGPNARQYYDGQGNHAATTMRAGQNTMVYGSDGSYLGLIQNNRRMSGE
jgi:YD repeat-containing protein